MPDFNIAKQIGGVNVAGRKGGFRGIEQRDILDTLFGHRNRGGSVTLPGGSKLYVGSRSGKNPEYSIGYTSEPGSDGAIKRPSIFAPTEGRLPLLTGLPAEGAGTGFNNLRGFLPEACRRILILGKHAYKDSMEGRYSDFAGHPSPDTQRGAEGLTDLIFEDAFRDPEEDVEDGWDHLLEERIFGLLGERVGETEKYRREFPGAPGGPSFEEFAIEMIGRVAEIVK